ncbi:MAG: hypothetical protein ABEJ98_00680 [Candidatus Nanohaloarchaea archaeon]
MNKREVLAFLGGAAFGAFAVVFALFVLVLAPLSVSQPGIEDVRVSRFNATHEEVSLVTENPSNVSVRKYVQLNGGSWHDVGGRASEDAVNHSIVVNLHSARFDEALSTSDVTGYKVDIDAWRRGELESEQLLLLGTARNLEFSGSRLSIR